MEAGIQPTAIVSIDSATAEKAGVSGYKDLFDLPADAVRYRPCSYSLTDPNDFAYFRDSAFDLLVVLGWQRIIPESVIAMLGCGGITVHGSGPGLPKGRGRSPMNWAMIEGYDRFHLSLLTLDSGADTGHILDTLVFDILPTDTIRTLYYKNAYAAAEMMVRTIPRYLRGEIESIAQDERAATMYPKRTPDDGRIDWSASATAIERLVRAVTRPYPGASTWNGEHRITIWGGQLFDHQLHNPGDPGMVVSVFPDGAFLVNTGTYLFLVHEYEGQVPRKGDCLR